MKQFCLSCAGLRTSVPDVLLDPLRTLAGVTLRHVGSGIVTVEFDGTEAELRALLADTAWSAVDVRVSESRIYRLQ